MSLLDDPRLSVYRLTHPWLGGHSLEGTLVLKQLNNFSSLQ
jgi:hypothetical protein